MAKVLSSFEFSAQSSKSRYPWADWADGKIRQLKQSEDFTCKAGALVAMARSYAKKHGKATRASVKRDEGIVVLQFYTPEPNGAAAPTSKTSKSSKRKSA